MIPLTQINRITPETKPVIHEKHDELKAEFGRLMHAAVINKRFRERLLENPIDCLETGYCGERFDFPFEMINCIKQINARSLEEFANQVLGLLSMPARKESVPLYCN